MWHRAEVWQPAFLYRVVDAWSKRERGDEDGDHQKGEADLGRHPDHESDPGGHARTSGAYEVATDAQLADYRADEWAQHATGEREERSRLRSERGAKHRPGTCAQASGAERGGGEVDAVARH